MSFVLGICNDETSSACILSEKALVAAASEERFTRVKADTSWPTKSIEFCLIRLALVLMTCKRLLQLGQSNCRPRSFIYLCISNSAKRRTIQMGFQFSKSALKLN